MPGNAAARKKEVCSQRVSNWDFDVLSTRQGHLRTLVSEKSEKKVSCVKREISHGMSLWMS